QAHMLLAITQMQNRKFKKALALLEDAKTWPENLGAGEPYDPDNRLQQYLQAICLDRLGKKDQANRLRDSIVAYTKLYYQHEYRPSLNNLLAFRIWQQRGEQQQASQLADLINAIPGAADAAAYQLTLAEYRQDKAAIAKWNAELVDDNYAKI